MVLINNHELSVYYLGEYVMNNLVFCIIPSSEYSNKQTTNSRANNKKAHTAKFKAECVDAVNSGKFSSVEAAASHLMVKPTLLRKWLGNSVRSYVKATNEMRAEVVAYAKKHGSVNAAKHFSRPCATVTLWRKNARLVA